MGFDKLFAPIAGQPVLAHTLRAFEETQSVERLILVGHAERLTDLQDLVSAYGVRKVSAIVPGGARRQDSVGCGLAAVEDACDYVAVHDAARALLRPELIERIFQAARTHGGAASGAPVIDTLKRVDDRRHVIGGVDRSNLFAVETPQIFRREVLERGFCFIAENNLEVSDEISAVEKIGGTVMLVPNESANFKITYPADLALAEFFLRR